MSKKKKRSLIRVRSHLPSKMMKKMRISLNIKKERSAMKNSWQKGINQRFAVTLNSVSIFKYLKKRSLVKVGSQRGSEISAQKRKHNS
jgi:hypothetical protein